MPEVPPGPPPIDRIREARARGAFDEATRQLQQRLRVDPFDADSLHEGALLAMATDDHAAAERLLAGVRLLRPRDPDLLLQAAQCAFRLRAPERAIGYLREGRALAPEAVVLRIRLVQMLCCVGATDEALAEWHRTRDLPVPPGSEVALEHAILGASLEPGGAAWREHARHWNAGIGRALPSQAFWSGEPRPDADLHVVAHGGLGDVLFFARFLPLAAARVRRVHLCVPRPLQALLAQAPGVASITPSLATIPSGSLICGLWQLAGLDDAPRAAEAYLEPSPRPSGRTAPPHRVGIAWAGNPAAAHDPDRSPPSLATFDPLLAVPGVEWVALHPEPERQAAARQHGLVVMPAAAGLDETARLVRSLDLVITVDSVVANLAPALGVPTWVFPLTMPEWRWPFTRSASPWFPSVRTFRRRHLHDWTAAVGTAADALRAAWDGRDGPASGAARRVPVE